MQTLSVLAVEHGEIIVATPTGERFRLPVDASLRSRLTSVAITGDERRLTPREIQAHVRSGLSAAQVAAMTGAPVADVERFVGPVLAERAYIVESALAVRLPPETEGARSRTFGAVMGERLDALAARDVRWSSAKEPSGWVLAVAFAADDVQHDARWRFDAKHMRLDPDNVEASTLSQQGVPAALTPRLRAIEPTAPVTVVPQAVPAVPQQDRSRFDSAVFHFPVPESSGREEPVPVPAAVLEPPVETASMPVPGAVDAPEDDGPVFAPRPVDRAAAPVTPLRGRPLESTEDEPRPVQPLRRRRDRGRAHVAEPAPTAEVPEAASDEARATPARPRRGRTSMPSWDEIVFGRDEP